MQAQTPNPGSGSLMRAVEYDRYGDPEVLHVRRVPRPNPAAGQVLVRVHATTVSPTDAVLRKGAMRLVSGRRFPKRTGLDFAGEIADVGAGVRGLAAGDRVWGFLGDVSGKVGAAAEFIPVKATALSQAPSTVDLVEAAALPSVGVTALTALRDVLRVRSGGRLLIVGASGGVGSAATQIANAMGAKVTAVASAGSLEFCQELGAAETVDYRAPRQLSGPFDAVLDCHGAELGRYRRLLRPSGRMMTTASSGMGYAMASVLTPGPRVRVMMAKSKLADLEALAAYVDRGKLRPVIEGVYPPEQIARLHRETATGHARGKRVVTMLDTPR